ncbi:hypothetical protein [Sulfobacillus harzensis]|uniref:hypothetical protein n=1 Tax=Sulfobacillus harzensis TaxID=2729629 RepID=UPI0030842945
MDLLHLIGDAPEGPWAIFSSPHGDGTDMISVIVPRSLWLLVTRAHPFDSEISLMEKVGRAALERALASGTFSDPVFAHRQDMGDLLPPASIPWFKALRICGQCGQEVPPGEVSEGLSNALPPDSRGQIDLKVLCPDCQVQTPHRLTPWGIPQE